MVLTWLLQSYLKVLFIISRFFFSWLKKKVFFFILRAYVEIESQISHLNSRGGAIELQGSWQKKSYF